MPLVTIDEDYDFLSLDTAAHFPNAVLRQDVVVIGGGPLGTYAAIDLKDAGKNVTVIEAQSVLGGHPNTLPPEPPLIMMSLKRTPPLSPETISGARISRSVLLNSIVLVAFRSGSGKRIVVSTPTGVRLILVEKIVISLPHLLFNFAGFKDTGYCVQSFQIASLCAINPSTNLGIEEVRFGAASLPLTDASFKAMIVSEVQKLNTAGIIHLKP
ncbi:MAG: hypothetical protein LQ350_005416 [Teloschistes chrysophthalmus]|nr:MAG: hypothetical protein LQ350_005416 [Niorma chrysophthalma]